MTFTATPYPFPDPDRLPDPRNCLAGARRVAPVDLPGLGGGWTFLGRLPELPSGPAEPLGGAFGRGGVLRAAEVVLRPYRRGGLLRHLNRGTYPSPRRFQEEFALHLALWTAGFPTVEPLGCAWRSRGWGVEGVYLTRLADAVPWPRCWERSSEVLPQVQAMVRWLAKTGIWSPDLNATNILVTPAGRVLALDWDRARIAPGAPRLARYLERMARSLEKLGAPLEVRATWGP